YINHADGIVGYFDSFSELAVSGGTFFDNYTPVEVASGSGTAMSNSAVIITNIAAHAGWETNLIQGYYTNVPVTVPAVPSADAVLTEHIDPYGNSIRLNYTVNTNGQF